MTHVVFLVHTFHQQQHEVCQTLDRLMCWVSIQAGHTIDQEMDVNVGRQKYLVFSNTLWDTFALAIYNTFKIEKRP